MVLLYNPIERGNLRMTSAGVPPLFLAVLHTPDLCLCPSPDLVPLSAVCFIPEQDGKGRSGREHFQDSACTHTSQELSLLQHEGQHQLHFMEGQAKALRLDGWSPVAMKEQMLVPG